MEGINEQSVPRIMERDECVVVKTKGNTREVIVPLAVASWGQDKRLRGGGIIALTNNAPRTAKTIYKNLEIKEIVGEVIVTQTRNNILDKWHSVDLGDRKMYSKDTSGISQ